MKGFYFPFVKWGIAFALYDVNLQEMLPWWDSLGCIVFMVIVSMALVLLKNKLKKKYLQVSL